MVKKNVRNNRGRQVETLLYSFILKLFDSTEVCTRILSRSFFLQSVCVKEDSCFSGVSLILCFFNLRLFISCAVYLLFCSNCAEFVFTAITDQNEKTSAFAWFANYK